MQGGAVTAPPFVGRRLAVVALMALIVAGAGAARRRDLLGLGEDPVRRDRHVAVDLDLLARGDGEQPARLVSAFGHLFVIVDVEVLMDQEDAEALQRPVPRQHIANLAKAL